jgi:hypothetical protein
MPFLKYFLIEGADLRGSPTPEGSLNRVKFVSTNQVLFQPYLVYRPNKKTKDLEAKLIR